MIIAAPIPPLELAQRELEKVRFQEFHGALDDTAIKEFLEKNHHVLCVSHLLLKHEGVYGNSTTERECLNMVEDSYAIVGLGAC